VGLYAPLIVDAAGETGRAIRHRLLYAAMALAFAAAAVISLWVLGLALSWNTPWRIEYLIATTAGFAIIAFICARLGINRGRAGPSTRTLKTEIDNDLRMLQQWREATN
jgi:uncharacterized membrane protein YqjE